MLTRSYDLHGLTVTVRAEKSILAAVHSRLACFAVTSNEHPALEFAFQPVTSLTQPGIQRPMGSGRPVLELHQGQVLYDENSQKLYLEVPGCACSVADLKTGKVLGFYRSSLASAPWLLSHTFLTIPLLERFKSQGIYPLHAAGLAIAGQGLLFPGASGSGKTTLTIALLRAGFEYLGDDTVFLNRGRRVLAFPDEIDITANTASFFPELQAFAVGLKPGQSPKRSLCPSSVFGAVLCRDCAPAVLVFPQPSASTRSTLVPFSKAEALLELGCNVVRTDARSAQAHLDTLAALVERCRCYRIRAGRDFEAIPELLKSVLTSPEINVSHQSRCDAGNCKHRPA